MARTLFSCSTRIFQSFAVKRIQPCRGLRPQDKGVRASKSSGRERKIVKTSLEGRRSPEQIEVIYEKDGGLKFRSLLRPFGFACLFTGATFAGSAIWQYETVHGRATGTRYVDFAESIFKDRKRGAIREELNRWYHTLSGTQKMVLGIIATNVAVFACWRIPAMQMFMIRWFSASPAANATCLPMVLSTFSQFSFWHLAVNMYVLWSFSQVIGATLGREQFLAFYLSGGEFFSILTGHLLAGVWSSFASYLVKVVTSSPRPSIGASGAVMAVLGAVCTHIPDAHLSIVFLPFFTFSAGVALKGLLAFESLGVLLRWRFFDHGAHLGGLLFGCYYVKDGYKRIWDQRGRFLNHWHKYRTKPGDT